MAYMMYTKEYKTANNIMKCVQYLDLLDAVYILCHIMNISTSYQALKSYQIKCAMLTENHHIKRIRQVIFCTSTTSCVFVSKCIKLNHTPWLCLSMIHIFW